jgi:hypothetical protein
VRRAALACIAVAALGAPRALAQDASPADAAAARTEPIAVEPPRLAVIAPAGVPHAWPSSPAPPTPFVGPRFEHALDGGRLALGVVLLGVGYVGAVITAIWSFTSLPFGDPTCSDVYGGVQLIPVVGPLIGVGAVDACIAGSLRSEEIFFPVLTTAFQLAGIVPLILGVVGHDDVVFDGPGDPVHLSIAPRAGPDGARLAIAGSW